MSNDVSTSLETLFSKMENFVSTKTVVGEPVTIGDIILVPLVDVAFGVAAGAVGNSEEKGKKENGLGGLGAKITPSAILVIVNGSVQLVNVKNQDSINKLIDMAPGIINKFNLGSIFSKKDQPETKAENTITPDDITTNKIIITE